MTPQDLPTQDDAFENASASLSLTDPYGRLIAGNEAFWELFGFDRNEPLNVGMLSRPDDQEWTLSYLTRLVTGDIDHFSSVKRFVRFDGSEFDGRVTITAIRRDGRCTGMIAHVDPVEVRSMVGDDRVRKLLEHSAGTLTLVDVDGNVIETSGRYRTTLGYPPEFWEDRTILDLLVPDDLPRVMAMRDEIMQSEGASVTTDVRVQSADRQLEHLEVTAVNMIHDPDLRGIVISSRNVTAERTNVDAIARLRDEAVAEAERRSSLLAMVSHELRNPLHAITGLAELLSTDPSLSGDLREVGETLYRQLTRLTAVTDDLLQTARLDVGQFELRRAPVVVRDIVDDVVRVAQSIAAERIDFDIVVDADVPHMIVTDAARLQQLIGNLVGNAVKFTERGTITVDVCRPSESLISFDVTDTGIGIPADELDRVFEAFASASTSGDRRGAGLGLAIVKRLVDAFGGTLDVTSTPAEGSRFGFILPLEASALVASPAEPMLATPDTTTARRRILVVEDTKVNQDLARLQLARLDMDAIIAGTAEEGLELLDAERFDAVLMDHQLPGMNGREATRQLRDAGDTTPIVGLTASSAAADREACLAAGMDGFLVKPASIDQLRVALAEVLDLPGPTADDLLSTVSTSSVRVADLDVLTDELGDRSVVESLVRTFLEELDVRSADIETGDAETAARQAHTLKSSARLLGAHQLADACAEVELDAATRSRIRPLATAAASELQDWLDVGSRE